MIVVSDASPIIALAAVGRAALLHEMYADVVIPEAVREELLAGPTGAATLGAAPWLRVVAPRATELAAELQQELHRGEAEAIALAVELGAELLLIDERRGRAAAERRGVKAMGLVGVLLEAKSAGLLASVRPILDALVERAGFYLLPAVYERAVREAGEGV